MGPLLKVTFPEATMPTHFLSIWSPLAYLFLLCFLSIVDAEINLYSFISLQRALNQTF